jgi:hypothetical protein
MGFPDLTFRAELDPVTRKELELFAGQLEGFLRSAGFNADGSFSTLTTTNLVVNNITAVAGSTTTQTGFVLVASRTLTHAQIRALPTTPVELRLPGGGTSAPGAGFVCNLVRWAFSLDTRAGVYTNLDNLQVFLSTGSVIQAYTSTQDPIYGNAGTWTGLSDPIGVPVPALFDSRAADNAPILVYANNNAGALTGGHASNTLSVHAYYIVTPLLAATNASGINWTSTGQLVAPAAAVGVTVTPNGTTLTYSAWFEITASTGQAWVLTGVSHVVGVVDTSFLVEIGVGAAGAEVAIAGMIGRAYGNAGGMSTTYAKWPIPIDAIPASSRVAVRLKKTGTDVTNWTVAITYLPKTITGNVDVTTVAPSIFTFAPNDINGSSPVLWSSGTWVSQGIATTSRLLWGIVIHDQSLAGTEYEIDVAVGASGSERVLTTIRNATEASSYALLGGYGFLPCVPVVSGITAGDVVSVRIRTDAGSAGLATPLLLTSATTATPFPLVTTDAQLSLRGNTTGLSVVTSAGAAWSNGSWVEVSPSLPRETAITGFSAAGLAGGRYELEFGTGAAGSEVTRGSIRLGQVNGGTGGDCRTVWLPVALNVAARARLAIRARGTTASDTLTIGVMGVDTPTFDQRTDALVAVYPPAAESITITVNTSAWANSAWVQLVASTATIVYLYQLVVTAGTFSIESELDIGIGAAAAETVLTTVRTSIGSFGVQYIPLPVPTKVAAGTRVSVRLRKAGTDGTNWSVALNYYGDLFA